MILGFMACTKDKGEQVSEDYRTKYIGNYSFVDYSFSFNGATQNYDWDTTYYEGSISAGASANQIIIDFSPSNDWELIIDSTGHVLELDSSNAPVSFNTDSTVEINYSSGGMGGGINHDITGFKQ